MQYYNGAISAMSWHVPGESAIRRYDYLYDGMNRLSKAMYSETEGTGKNPLVPRDTLIANTMSLIPIMHTETETQNSAESLSIPGININPLRPISTSNKYGEEIEYDKNSNITRLKRYGAKDDLTYGLIDDLEIAYNGNQRDSIIDNVDDLSYTGSSEFVSGGSGKYSYNGNGALLSDENRDISSIEYDYLGNPKKIRIGESKNIDYVYSADGTKLREIHTNYRFSSFPSLQTASVVYPGHPYDSDTTEYIGSLVIKNGHPIMLHFDGGYVSFDSDTISGIHYYIQDYMGNNRMVVNRDGTIEQITHYYPYGGVIGDISTNENLQKFKFEGKELDRTFGLDNYDIHARNYFAMAPMWDRPDSKAEDYYGISPYVFCGGDPVNFGDYDGRDKFYVNSYGYVFNVEKCPETILLGTNLKTGQKESILINDDAKAVMDDLAVKNYEMSGNHPVNSIDDVNETTRNIKPGGTGNEHKSVTASDQATEIFLFVAKHSTREWHMSEYTDGSKLIGTRQSKSIGDLGDNGKKRRYKVHSHPNNPEPSDADINNVKTKPGRAFVYSPTTDTVTEYDGNGPKKTRDVTDNKEFRFVK